ncbi:MarR family winged helix-turn-helix transcriptional regulator [Streptomyces sp. Isolate_219]|uniref:MarR family winged helix-turn-helix transcriptional regulator n=1 Tax=Streptomyces sp. Isolate_219 TaxID=2950110 RepID=UPI003966EAEE
MPPRDGAARHLGRAVVAVPDRTGGTGRTAARGAPATAAADPRPEPAPRPPPPSRTAALAALAAHGPLRIGELAARMHIVLSTTSRMVDLLDACGWIARRPDPADQRASLISLNDDGLALLRAVRRETTGLLAERIGRLAPDRRRLLYDALPALEEMVEWAPPPAGPPSRRPAATDPAP